MNQHAKNKNSLLKSNPKVSIICVAYNPGDRAKITFDSIAALSYTNTEVILIDNCSDAISLRIYESYKSLISVYCSEPDLGIYDAMNKGVSMASGEWIWFMNMGDTFAEPKIIERIFSKVNSTKIKVIFGDTLVVNGSLKFIKRFYPPIEKNFKHGILQLNHQSMLMHAEVFEKIGKFDFRKYPIRGDMHHLTKTFFAYQSAAFLHVEFVLAKYLEDGVSSNANNLLKMFDEDIYMQKEFNTLFNIPSIWVMKWYSYAKSLGLNAIKSNLNFYMFYRRFKYYFVTNIEEQK